MKWPTSRPFGLIWTAQRFFDAFEFQLADQREPCLEIKDTPCHSPFFRPGLSLCKINFSVWSSEG